MGHTATATKATLRAAVYVRISSDRDGTALGVKRQEKDCRAICAERGWEPLLFADNDLSAADPKITRPAYEEMLEAVAAGAVVAVVAWDLDRLTRQPGELEHFLTIADRAGLRHLVGIDARARDYLAQTSTGPGEKVEENPLACSLGLARSYVGGDGRTPR